MSDRPVGRPPGTVESLEQMAKQDALANLKLSAKIRKIIEAQIPRIQGQLDKLNPEKPGDIIIIRELTEFLIDAQDKIMKSVAGTVKVASGRPTSDNDTVTSASEKEFLRMLEGER